MTTIHYAFVGLVIVGSVSAATADPQPTLLRVQAHAGQLDHDGILSPGELPNRDIDYDRAQREHERRGDYRVENPDNDELADEDRREKRGQLSYDREREDDLRRREIERSERHRSWWDWW